MNKWLKVIENEISYRALYKTHPSVFMLLDPEDGAIVDVNDSALKFYGYSYDEMTAMKIADINTYSSEEVAIEIELAKSQHRNYFRFVHQLKNGSFRKVTVRSYPVVINNKTLLFSFVENQGIDEVSVERFNIEDFINESIDSLCLIEESNDDDKRVLYANKAFYEIVGKEPDEISFLSDFIVDFPSIRELIGNCDANLNIRIRDHEDLLFAMQGLEIRFEGHNYYVLSFKGTSYERVNELLCEPLKEVLGMRYKDVEGYVVGIEFYQRASTNIRFNEWYHDFVNKLEVFLSDANINHELLPGAGNVCFATSSDLEAVTAVLETMILHQHNFDMERGISNYVKFRIGVSDYGTFTKERFNALKKALNSYGAAEYNTIKTTSAESSIGKSLKIMKDIDRAIANDEFVIYVQPLVNILENNIEGLEALLRWEHPEFGLLTPDRFIDLAITSSKIIDIDLWVIKKCLDISLAHPDFFENRKLHVNVTTKTFSDKRLFELMREAKYRHVFKNIILEITEESNSDLYTDVFFKVQRMGLDFAIDDFGTGYSSFERIKKTGVRYIKIDKSFIQSLQTNPDDLVILRTILNMCNNLNIQVIAEGVEHIEQIEFLRSKKCYIIQGYFFSRPVEFNEFLTIADTLEANIADKVKTNSKVSAFSNKFYNDGRIFIQDVDSDYHMIDPNIQLAIELGYSLDEIEQKAVTELMSPEEEEYFKQAIDKVLNFGEVVSVRTLLQTKYGEHLEVICGLKQSDKHFMRMYIEVLEDSVEDESNLMGLSLSYVETFYSVPVGMIILSEDYVIKRWNQAAGMTFGYSSNEAIGQNILKFAPDAVNELSKMFRLAEQMGQSSGKLELQTKYETDIVTNWVVKKIDSIRLQERSYVCIVQDITSQVELEKEQFKIHKALDQSKSVIVMTDLAGNFEYVNDTFVTVTGYQKEDIIGKGTNILSSGQQTHAFYKELWMTITKGEIWNGEFYNKKKDESYYWCKATIYPIVEDGQIVGYMGIQEDITHEKELVDINEDLKNRLIEQEKIASLGMLTTGIMHEINNPLAYIQGNISYLNEMFKDFDAITPEDIDEINETFDDISKGIVQIKKIAEGLKRYIFKNDSEDMEMVDLVDAINEVLVISKNEYKYHANIKLDYEPYEEGEEYLVVGIATKLKQVIMNLVINATHAITDKFGDDLGEIYIKLIKDNQNVVMFVQDNGPGIPEEIQKKVFEPFFTTKVKGVGSGLGLSITKQIIEEDHQGTLDMKTVKGEGTTFIISLPRSKQVN